MKIRTLIGGFAAILLLQWAIGLAADSTSERLSKPMAMTELDKLAGQPVDVAPWAYVWCADRKVQEKPEAYFIPHRLERIDKVYRTAATALTPQELKSSNYANQPDMLKKFPSQPKGRLQAGLLWTGRLHDYKVELQWPSGQKIPTPDAVDVRVYPTSWGWFGWTVDTILSNPEISADGRTWTYKSDPAAKMDFSYNNQVDAGTEMVAVFYGEKKSPGSAVSAVPSIHVTGPDLGAWKRMDVEIEWGFQPGTEKSEFDGSLEPSMAIAGPVAPWRTLTE